MCGDQRKYHPFQLMFLDFLIFYLIDPNTAYRETGLSGADMTTDDQARQRKAIERLERSWLWHGTNVEVMDKIMQQGFNRSFW